MEEARREAEAMRSEVKSVSASREMEYVACSGRYACLTTCRSLHMTQYLNPSPRSPALRIHLHDSRAVRPSRNRLSGAVAADGEIVKNDAPRALCSASGQRRSCGRRRGSSKPRSRSSAGRQQRSRRGKGRRRSWRRAPRGANERRRRRRGPRGSGRRRRGRRKSGRGRREQTVERERRTSPRGRRGPTRWRRTWRRRRRRSRR